jgi:hypothetical protein
VRVEHGGRGGRGGGGRGNVSCAMDRRRPVKRRGASVVGAAEGVLLVLRAALGRGSQNAPLSKCRVPQSISMGAQQHRGRRAQAKRFSILETAVRRPSLAGNARMIEWMATAKLPSTFVTAAPSASHRCRHVGLPARPLTCLSLSLILVAAVTPPCS